MVDIILIFLIMISALFTGLLIYECTVDRHDSDIITYSDITTYGAVSTDRGSSDVEPSN